MVSISAVYRPKGVGDHRYIGDKRTGVLYDLDALAPAAEPHAATETDAAAAQAVIEELIASGRYLCFAPDTLAEARHRGYRLRRR